MTISAGTRLGPYEIVAPIGAGGMGEVYRGRDTRLDRSVAIKILPAGYANDAHLKLRFDREAKTISQLNHPNICTVYDVGHENGTDYLVMELLEGQTLADRLARGPLPLADVLTYGIQIAEALEKAHRAGIVHRDLKPANVMLTKSGAKLLDFGLAKSASVLVSSESATHHRPLTQEGTIVGTFQYMAPEQLEGVEADARTDIFALGTVLYEMATGKRAFDGKTKTSLIAAIVSSQPPPISQVQALAPAAFERVVNGCLAKDAADRWQSAHDVRLALQMAGDPSAAFSASRERHRGATIAAVVLAVIATALAALYGRAVIAARGQPTIRTSITPPDGLEFDFVLDAGPPAISPDGKSIAFLASGPGATRTLFVRAIDALEPRQLRGTDGASQPFWSPDSRSIAFYVDNTLKRIDAAGGVPITICETDGTRGGSWSPDGTIIFGRIGGSIAKVAATGGNPVDATALSRASREVTHRWPHFLPDGKHFLFLSGPHGGDATDYIAVGSTDSQASKRLIPVTSNAEYIDGWLIFARDERLMAQRFDVRELELTGHAIALPEPKIDFDGTTSRPLFSVSPVGLLLYETGSAVSETTLTWFDRGGKRLSSAGDPQRYGSVSLSSDGRYLAYSLIPRQNLWMFDFARGVRTRLTYAKSSDFFGVWSPDGTRIAFASHRDGHPAYDIYVKDLRSGAETPLIVNENDKIPNSWSADGKTLFYTERTNGPQKDDIEYFTFGDRSSHVFVSSPFNESQAAVSPDGKWVAYVSSENPPLQVMLSPFPPTGAKWQVSANVGTSPRWRGDGKELFYYANGKVVAAAVTFSTPPEIGQAVPMFSIPFGLARRWDVTLDGLKFVAPARSTDEPPPPPLTLVQNFRSELRKAAASVESAAP